MKDIWGKLHEECGVFGVYCKGDADLASMTYYALFALQHRGQEGCGIAIENKGRISVYRDAGLVNDVFTHDAVAKLGTGHMAVGHVRYGTTGSDARLNVQPLVVNHIRGQLVIAHNGNLTNDVELREQLEMEGSIFHTTSDTEVISYIITKELLHTDDIEEAVSRAMVRLMGAYSIVVMTRDKLIAARDPFGFHPLCIGKTDDCYVAASETCALDTVNAEFIRDIAPGEIVVFDSEGMHSRKEHMGKTKGGLCVFEFLYFARPDSIIDGSSVHIARQRAGAFLALEHPVQADVVIGVPDSGIDAAIGYARQSGIPYGIGFIKNKYIGRTFIQPTQSDRENKVRIKLNPVSATVRGKRVVLIDDSIVRGTTSERIVRLLREAGATEVHFRSSAPKFLYPCFFGTDIDSQEHLIAWQHSDEEMCRMIGVDSLGFLSTENVKHLADNTDLEFCTGCFTGKYPCEPPKRQGKEKYGTVNIQGQT